MKNALPGVLQEIADVIGEAGALSIAARHGGTRVYFPATGRIQHDIARLQTDALSDGRENYWLIECVGPALALKICAHFEVDGRGQRIDIPLYVGGTYRQFARKIQERVQKLEDEGASSTEIARQVGISQRTIHRRRRKLRGKDDKQNRMF